MVHRIKGNENDGDLRTGKAPGLRSGASALLKLCKEDQPNLNWDGVTVHITQMLKAERVAATMAEVIPQRGGASNAAFQFAGMGRSRV